MFSIFGLGALVGLFVFATYTGKNSSGSGAIGTVVVWGSLPSSDIRSILTAIAQTDPSLNGVSYAQKDSASLSTELATAIATGAAPDLLLFSQEELHSLKKFITPIPFATLPVSTFEQSFISEGNVFAAPEGAGYYGVPFLVDPLVLFSNRDILTSNNIVTPPSTWESLVGLVPRLAVLTSSRQITRGLIGLGTYDNVHNARGILSTLFLQLGIPMSSYSTAGLIADLGSGSSLSGGTSALGFYTQFADPAKVSYTWNTSLPDSTRMFYTGDLALYIGYASEARYLRAANPNLNFSVSPIPQSAVAKAKSVYGLLYAFMMPRGAKNIQGAYQVATMLTGAGSIAAQSTGLAPATLNNLAQVPPTDPIATVSYAEALYSKGWISPVSTATDQIFSGMIGSVISGRSSLGTALGTAERSLGALLQQ